VSTPAGRFPYDIPPDQLGAARLLLALREDDSPELWRVLMSSSTLPLLTGLATIALAFGVGHYGEERLDSVLRLIALDGDGGELRLPDGDPGGGKGGPGPAGPA
jgi:hypothetical protein